MPVVLRSVIFGYLLAASQCSFESGTSPPSTPTPTPSPTLTPAPTPTPVNMTIDFATDASWTAGYADYEPGMETNIAFASGLRDVPAPIVGTKGFLLGGRNESDDLFMFAWREVQNLAPDARYRVRIELTIATDAPADCPGAGGSEGEAVWVKGGAIPRRPQTALNPVNNLYEVNADKGDQIEDGTELLVLGNLASPEAGDCLDPHYALKTMALNDKAPLIRTSSEGRMWIVLGTDSGFESRTEVYLVSARIRLDPQAD